MTPTGLSPLEEIVIMVRCEGFLLLSSCDGGKTEVEAEPMELKQAPQKETDTSQVAQSIENLPASAGDVGSIPGWGRSPGEGNDNPLQYSCLRDPRDRGAWRATVRGVAKSRI